MQYAGQQNCSRETYLAQEKQSEVKHEFYLGEVFAMTGGTFNHATISGNILTTLSRRLQNKPCRPINSDMRIHTPDGLDTYPDISVFCGRADLTDEQRTLLNPVVIFEVLSPSTRSYDRGDKFVFYRSIPTLRDYVLVDSTGITLEHYRRADSNGEWILHEYKSDADTLPLPAIDVQLPLQEIYHDIAFENGDIES